MRSPGKLKSGRYFAVAIFCCVLIAFGTSLAGDDTQSTPARAQFKNVIVMVADGCGLNIMRATDYYTYGRIGDQPYERFPLRLMMSTYSVEGGYDGAQALSNPDYLRSGATDSAAAATAIATGVKTYDSAIGVGPDRKPVKNVVERAEELGKATGVVTSVEFSHATPAGFVAHNESRSAYSAIAAEMIEKSSVDAIMGCGHPLYTSDGVAGFNKDTDKNDVDDAADYAFVGGKELWESLVAGKAGARVDADHNGQLDDAWTLIETRDAFRKLADGAAPKRVLGVPRVYATLQQGRGGDAKAAPFAVPFTTGVPTLAEMSAAALNVLDDDPDGLFLIVEGGAVDWANHNNQSGRAIEECTAFNEAIRAVCDWVEKKSSWSEAVLIVTADHETGYVAPPGKTPDEKLPTSAPLAPTKAGDMPVMKYNSGSHTNSLVPFFANGVGATMFVGYPAGYDPVYGRYIDNTTIAKVIFEAWQDPPAALAAKDAATPANPQ